MIVYTSDHGHMMGAHGLHGKGPYMYEEVTNVPFIVRTPDRQGRTSDALVSHLDVLPTVLDALGIDRPECLHGESLLPLLDGSRDSIRETAMIDFHRFSINHDSRGGFYPIRCLTDGRHKLVVNLFETDEFYDLQADPHETTNLIDDPAYASVREELHERLLDRMDEIRDPFRSFRWGDRPWNRVRDEPPYTGGANRDPPGRFPFQPGG